MPGDTGFSVVERLMDAPALAGKTVMLLSSDPGRGDAQRCQELGILLHRVKPVTPSELLGAVLEAVGAHARPAPTAGADGAQVTRNRRALRVLVAEDNRVNQRVIVRMLEKRHHLPTVCGNGREALEAFTGAAFDLVLMDVQMPEMDGLAATAAIRQYEAGHAGPGRVPIVALTAFAMASDRERCLAAGMDDYLSKPIRDAELALVLDRACGDTAALRPGDRAVPAFDESAALEYVGGDRELLSELIGIFAVDGVEYLHALQEAMAASDPAALMRAAHTLKGSLRVLGARRAAELSAQLEALGRAGDLEPAPLVLEAFEPELQRVLRAAAESAGGVAVVASPA